MTCGFICSHPLFGLFYAVVTTIVEYKRRKSQPVRSVVNRPILINSSQKGVKAEGMSASGDFPGLNYFHGSCPEVQVVAEPREQIYSFSWQQAAGGSATAPTAAWSRRASHLLEAAAASASTKFASLPLVPSHFDPFRGPSETNEAGLLRVYC